MIIHPYDFVFVGLSLDIFGAIILAKGFMMKDIRSIYYESRSMFDCNLHLLKSSLIQRAEAQVGAILLIIGFFLQMWGNLHGGIEATQPGWVNTIPRMFVLLFATFILTVFFLIITHLNAQKTFYLIFFKNYQGKEYRIQEYNGTTLDRVASFIDLKRKTGESDESLIDRLNNKTKKLGAKYTGKASNLIGDDE